MVGQLIRMSPVWAVERSEDWGGGGVTERRDKEEEYQSTPEEGPEEQARPKKRGEEVKKSETEQLNKGSIRDRGRKRDEMNRGIVVTKERIERLDMSECSVESSRKQGTETGIKAVLQKQSSYITARTLTSTVT